MASTLLQVGQCGNQLGQSFWSREITDTGDASRLVFRHRQSGKLRSINVDSEPKGIRRLLKHINKSNFPDDSIIIGQQGRGSNWAMGYNGLQSCSEDKLFTQTMEAMRRQTERCDSFMGTIIMHSLSGGTGSGLGSRLCEAIRDEYPLKYLLSCTVAPHSGGESPLQHYNSLLCLSWLQRYCDGVLLFTNDFILERFRKLGKRNVGLSSMNDYITDCLRGVFVPADSLTPSSGMCTGLEPWEMLRSVCPMPDYKFMLPNTISGRKDSSWTDMCSSLMRTTQNRDDSGRLCRLISSLVIARGDTASSFTSHIKVIEDKVKSSFKCVSWNPFPMDVWTDRRSIHRNNETSLTFVSNSSAVGDVCSQILQRSEEMFNAKAYLHWYWRHGCSNADFEDAFNTVSHIANEYRQVV